MRVAALTCNITLYVTPQNSIKRPWKCLNHAVVVHICMLAQVYELITQLDILVLIL